MGPQAGRKVFTLQTLPACDESFNDQVGKMAGFSLHAGVAARADERNKSGRLCGYITRPALVENRLSPKPNGNVRCQYRAVTGAMVRERPLCSESGHSGRRPLR